MDTGRMKKTAEWFYNTVFKDEAIRPRSNQPSPKLPSVIRTARSLETGMSIFSQSREALFLKQAKLLANYEDTYEFHGEVVRYFPTYQSLTDPELRGYFAWRTGVRQGDIQKTSLSFAFLYIYELLNQAGVDDPMEGYRKLSHFWTAYAQLDDRITPYLCKWLPDYVVYYDLDAGLLASTPQVIFDRSLAVLEQIQTQDDAKVMDAVKNLAPGWLNRSKFYGANQEDFDTVILRVLRRVARHYDTKCKKGFVEQYFGSPGLYTVNIFDNAVFCNPLKRRDFEYTVDDRCVYRCKNGLWSVHKTNRTPSNSKLGDLLKTIDAVMRDACQYRHPVKAELDTKWILTVIGEEVQDLLSRKNAEAAKTITIDYSQLARIRRDAAVTQEKLTVEEEWEEEPVRQEISQPAPLPLQPAAHPDKPLSPPEYRLMQCLLYGGSLDWIHGEGHMLSVLVDSINETLYDQFMDSVLDDTPELIPDYIDDLKEMVHP